MKFAIKMPGRAARYILGGFRPRAVPLLSGALVMTAAMAST